MRNHFRVGEALRSLLHPDVWPHAGRSSFVNLLMEKSVPTHGVGVENAVGLRLTFRQPPPIDCFSNQFLFYLNSSMTRTAYRTWARLAQDHTGAVPARPLPFPGGRVADSLGSRVCGTCGRRPLAAGFRPCVLGDLGHWT